MRIFALAGAVTLASALGVLAEPMVSIPPNSAPPSLREALAVNDPVSRSLRPVLRPEGALGNLLGAMRVSTPHDGFTTWLSVFRIRALAQGISASTFDTAIGRIQYDTDVIRRDRNQSEFTKTI